MEVETDCEKYSNVDVWFRGEKTFIEKESQWIEYMFLVGKASAQFFL